MITLKDKYLLLQAVMDRPNLFSDREKKIIALRFNAGREMTLEAVGKRIGVTRERIRQIEAKCLDRIKNI